jgi:hypothetical protein
MSFTETSLISALQAYTADTGTDYSGQHSTIITLAETRIAKESDLNVFRKYATSVLTAGDPFVILPTDFVVGRHMHLLQSTTRKELYEKQVDWLTDYAPDRTVQAEPKYWAHWDEANLMLAPTPDAADTLELAYTKRPTTLVGVGASTTWISSNAPDVLLYACLLESIPFLKEEPAEFQVWDNLYQRALASLVVEQQGRNRRTESRRGEPRVDR